jgi:hypothetical protein
VDKEHGYLQYRYGRPGKIELEFPKSGMGTQQMFQCTHYMRYQVDLRRRIYRRVPHGFPLSPTRASHRGYRSRQAQDAGNCLNSSCAS